MANQEAGNTGAWRLNRREVIRSLGAFAATAGVTSRSSGAPAINGPIVEVSAGKVRGERLAGGGYRFLCLPYGAPTGGDARFMPPRPVAPWAGVREPPRQPLISPQVNPNAPAATVGSLRAAISAIGSEAGSLETEDCLNLTIYTPGLDSRRRPVMFWCHGGGYFAGSGSAPMYDGTQLALHGDVVVVNVTHRLGVLGYSHLLEAGDEFAASGNVGMMDIVLALQWVRDHIGRFGGDPKKVLIFGQSGGGGKVSVLTAMPSARGLFHRAAIQSGALRRLRAPADANEVTATLMSQLGLKPSQGRELQRVPLPQLMQAFFSLARLPASPGKPLNFEPVLDRHIVPRNPFDPVADPLNASVPLIVGCVRTESTAFMLGDEAAFALDSAALATRLTALLGQRTGEAAAALYSRLEPAASASDLYFEILSDRTRRQSILIAELKAAQGAGNAYLYELIWNTPVFDGKLRSPHSLDLPMVFDIADGARWTPYTGGGAGAQEVARAMSEAWAAFAHSGVPETARLRWPAYTLEQRQTMLFDEASKASADPRRETRVFWDDVANGVI